jgi:hypothetical protein
MLQTRYQSALSIGKQSGKEELWTCALPFGQLWVISPGTFGEPITQPLLNEPRHATNTQYTINFGNLA